MIVGDTNDINESIGSRSVYFQKNQTTVICWSDPTSDKNRARTLCRNGWSKKLSPNENPCIDTLLGLIYEFLYFLELSA